MEFVTYRKFTEPEQAEALAAILAERGIEFQIEKDPEGLDSLYGGLTLPRNFYVKLRKVDFSIADRVLLEIANTSLDAVDKDYHLWNFSNEELFEILSKPDEWSEFDYQLAHKILNERGKEISIETIELLRIQRIRELSRPEEGHKSWIYAGYFFSVLGGLIGVFIGLHLSTFKRTLPNGERVFGYNRTDRHHGWRILILGVVMFFLSLFIKTYLADR